MTITQSERVAEDAGLIVGLSAGWRVLIVASLGSGMTILDGIAVNVALPRIGAGLHASTEELQWVVNAFTLAVVSFLLLAGSLGDRFGRRRVFVIGASWFTAGSLLCSLAPTIGFLIAGRALQGMGGALLVPGALALLQANFAPRVRPRAIGAFAGIVSAVGAAGPILGGYLIQLHSWRLVFLINLPLAVVLLFLARGVPESSNPAAARRLDTTGTILGALALGGLTYGLIAWSSYGAGDTRTVTGFVIGVSMLGAFVLVESRAQFPLVPLRLFRVSVFGAGTIATLVLYAAIEGVLFFLIFELQIVLGLSPFRAGLSLLPLTVTALIAYPVGGALSNRTGPRIPITLGLVVSAIALLPLAQLRPGRALIVWDFGPLVILGVGLGLVIAPLVSVSLGSAHERNGGIASGVNNSASRIGGLLAVAALPLVSGVGTGLTNPVTLGPAYRVALWVCAGAFASGAAFCAGTMPSSYADIRTAANRVWDPPEATL